MNDDIADGSTDPDMPGFLSGFKDGRDKPKMDGNTDGSVNGCIDGSNVGLMDVSVWKVL